MNFSAVLKQHWDSKKTLKQNMKDLGLAFNPNDTAAGNPKKKGKKVHTCIATPFCKCSAHLHRGASRGRGIHPLPSKRKVSLNMPFAPKKGAK